MVHKQTIVNNYVAVIFLVLLAFGATVNLTSANPLSSTDSPTKKPVVDYNVQISEDGEQYNETIEVDTEKQTELFKVPAHKDVDESNILHDFKTNKSMLLLPEKKICYLLPLSEELPSPEKLESDLDNTKKTDADETTIIDTKWVADGEITNRSLLSDELANFCPEDYPIFHAKIMEESLNSTRIQTGRTKRWISPRSLCPGGKSRIYYYDRYWCSWQRKTWYRRCRVTSRTCYSMWACRRYWYWYGYYRYSCRIQHVVTRLYCCEYVCASRFAY